MIKLRKSTDAEVQRYKTIIESLEKVSNIRRSNIEPEEEQQPAPAKKVTTKKPPTTKASEQATTRRLKGKGCNSLGFIRTSF